MKKFLYVFLAAATVATACAKEEVSDVREEPAVSSDYLFSGSIIQPNGLNTKTTLVDDQDNQVSIAWEKGDEIKVYGNGSWNAHSFYADSDGTKVYFGFSSPDTMYDIVTWLQSNDASGYVAYYPAYTYESDLSYFDCKTSGNVNQASLQNMPLVAKLGEVTTPGHVNRKLSFSSPYAIFKFTVPAGKGIAKMVVNANDPQEHIYEIKTVTNIQELEVPGQNTVEFYVPVLAINTATEEYVNYKSLTFTAKDSEDHPIATMESYAGYTGNVAFAGIDVKPNTIYYFDFCNTKTIDEAGTYELVNNGIDYKINVSADVTGDVIIKYADGEGTHPANISINARGHKIGNLVVNTPNSHVVVSNGESVSATAITSLNTFVVKGDYKIIGLTVEKGSVVVEGTEDHKANVETITIPADAEGFINIDVTGVTAGDKKVVIDNQSTNGTVQLVKSTGSKYEIKEGSKPVAEIEGDVAQIGDKKYFSLAEAIADVKDGETVTLLKNVDQAFGISVPEGSKTFTVDFGGFTYKVEKPGAGSANTKTQAFQLKKGNTITFKNGTIECTEANKTATWTSDSQIKGVAMIIQNYANLTLEDMTIDATNIAHNGAATRYAISNNSGNVEFKGATSIISDAGDYAFDVCKYYDYTKPVVTWNSTGSVNGVIELSGGDFIVAKDLKVSRPIRSNSNPSTLTVNSGVTVSPAAKFPAVETAFANANNEYKKFNEFTSGVVIVNRGGNLTINGEGTITSTAEDYCYAAVCMTETGEAAEGDKAKLTIDGNVTLEGLYYGVVGNGQRHDTEITVKGGTVKGLAANDNAGIYHPQKGILTINGGTIEGAVGVYVKSGNVVTSITGGTIKGVGIKKDYVTTGDGLVATGDAIAFDNCDYPGGAPNADIKGGTFTSTNASAVASYAKEGKEPITGFITGGTFNTQPAGDLIADGYKIKKVSDTEYTVSAIDANDVATINGFAYSDLATALSALKAGETLKIWKAGEYTVETLSTPANTTVEGMAANRGVVFNHTAAATSWVAQCNGSTVKNVTWNVGNAHHQYFSNTNLENCTVNGLLCTHQTEKFKDCTFNNEVGYNFWVYGNEYTEFDNCTFNCPGKNDGVTGCGSAINCYNEGNQAHTSVLVIKNCTFTAKEASNKYSAIYIKPETSFDIRITNSTCNDKFCTGDKSGSKLWNVKEHKNLNTKVTVDGKLEYEKGSLVGISTPDQLKAFATAVNGGNKYEGLTVTLLNDLNLSGVEVTPIGAGSATFGGTFDGNGKTISNMEINGSANGTALFGHVFGATIKDLNVTDAKVTNTAQDYTGILAGNGYAKISGCTITGTVEGQEQVGAVIGYLSCGYIKNCTVNATVKGTKRAGILTAKANVDSEFKIEDNIIKGSVTSSEDIYAGGVVGQIMCATGNTWTIKNNSIDATVSNGGSLIGNVRSGYWDAFIAGYQANVTGNTWTASGNCTITDGTEGHTVTIEKSAN